MRDVDDAVCRVRQAQDRGAELSEDELLQAAEVLGAALDREDAREAAAVVVQWLAGSENVPPVPTPQRSLFGRARSAEDVAFDEQLKARQRQTKADALAAREWERFWQSPQGRARRAFEDGDALLQISLDVMSQQAVVVVMVGAQAPQDASDSSQVLNAVVSEGWELINGSFVFVQQRQQSRDKFMSSGQNIAIEGMTIGYYLFKRNPALRSR